MFTTIGNARDCAVSVRESVSAQGWRAFGSADPCAGITLCCRRLTRVADGIVSWRSRSRLGREGSLIARTGESEARAGIFLGVRRHSRSGMLR